jgi:hypothetical protein
VTADRGAEGQRGDRKIDFAWSKTAIGFAAGVKPFAHAKPAG